EQRDAVQPFVGAKPEHQLEHLGVGGETLALIHGADQARRRHQLEALVDADEEFRRNDRTLDSAELRALDLPRDRAELARRIDFGFYAPAGILLQRRRVAFGKEITRVVQRRTRYLH